MKISSAVLSLTSLLLLAGCKKENTPIEPPSSGAEEFWQATSSPRVIIRSLVMSSNTSLFAESPSGIWRSLDSGATWEPALNASTTGFLTAGSHGQVFASTVGGVYRSTDYGSTWAFTDSGLHSVYSAALAVSSNGTVFLGTMNSGIYRSTDNGISWTRTDTTMPKRDIRSLLITSNGMIFAGANYRFNVIFRSTSNGTSWVELPSLSNQIIFSMASDSAGGVLAGGLGVIYRSVDAGTSWTQIGSTQSYFTSIVSAPNNHIFVTVAGGDVFRSSNFGSSWEDLNTSSERLNARCLLIDDRGYIFAGTDGSGIYRSRKPITMSANGS
jgi:photosystem II stability/assembly factor-like uncharacterized protein